MTKGRRRGGSRPGSMGRFEQQPASDSKLASTGESVGASKWGRYAAQVTAFLFSTQFVWSMLQPHDAVGVFRGNALPQNLLWLATACIASIAGCTGVLRLRLPYWLWGVTAALLVSLVLTAVLAGAENNPRIAWFGFWQVVSVGSAYAIARSFSDCATQRSVLVGLLLAGGIGLSFLGLYETFVSMPAARAEYLQDPDAYLAGNPEVNAPAGSPARKRFEDRFLNSKEPLATFALTNSLAVLLTVVLVLGVGCLVTQQRTSQDTQGALQPAWSLSVMLLAIAFVGFIWFLTRSRTAYVGLMAALVYLWGINRLARRQWSLGKSGQLAFGVLVLLFVAGALWLVSNDSLVLSESLYSLRFRLDYWFGSVSMLREHWLLGVGLGNFQAYYPAFMLETASETIADPHNWFFDIATTLGLPVAIGVSLFVLAILLPSGRPSANHSDAESAGEFDLSRGLFGGAIVGGLLVASVLAGLVGLEFVPLLIGFGLGGGVAFFLRDQVRGVAQSPSTVLQAMAFAFAVCLLVSGSWQASGLAVPAAVVFALAFPSGRVGSQGESSRGAAGLLGRLGPVAFAGVGLAVFAVQTWLPVTSGWLLAQQIDAARSGQNQLELAKQWEAADWLDSSATAVRAQILVGQSIGDVVAFKQVHRDALDAIEVWLSRDPRPFGNWQLASTLVLDLASAAKQFGVADEVADLLDLSSRYSQEAVARYPSSVALNVQAAVCLKLAGDAEGAQTFVAEAIRLSEQTPHEDKRLAAQQVYLPSPLGSLTGQSTLVGQGQRNAELVVQWLRNE